MTRPVAWLPQAAAELDQARAYYDRARPELGDRFALAVDATIVSIARAPLQFPVIYREIRRAGVRHFPYGVFFQLQGDRILIVACFHSKRDPRRWQAR